MEEKIMIETYKEQIGKIIKRTQEKSANSDDKFAAVTMFKVMVAAISNYVEREAVANTDFNAALSLEYKSAERMLKYVWRKAQELAIPVNTGSQNLYGSCIPEDIVYDWVSEYYFLDDKKEYEEEQKKILERKQAEEKRKKEEKEKKELARSKALEKLSKEETFSSLSETEKEDLIEKEIKKILPTLNKKRADKKKQALKDAISDAKDTLSKMEDKSVHTDSEKKVETASENTPFTDKIEVADDQFTLFDLMGGGLNA